MGKSRTLNGRATITIDGRRITLLKINEKGECEYLVSEKEMDDIRGKLLARIQEGVNSCSFDTIT